MSKQSEKQSTDTFKEIVSPLKNNGEDLQQQQQSHVSCSSAKTTVVGKTTFYDSSNTPELTHSLASTSLSTIAKDVKSQQNLESIRLIWYDSNIDKTNDTKETMKKLREINNFVVFHIELEACIDSIKSITNEKIFLITSGKNAAKILRKVHTLRQVDSIFIFLF
ncbi:unnamed protein product [Rotaria sp. Silwood1]|nr:unnamed protein product [Rotaria sp. Silwood1]